MRRPFVTIFLIVAAVVACGAVAGNPPSVAFTDVTAAAGLRFVHNNGAFGSKYLPETLGSGCLFLDADGDGWQDILLLNSTNWPGHAGPKSSLALYRNNRNGTFTDVTAASGLGVELYALGGAAADYDNDGKLDLFVARYVEWSIEKDLFCTLDGKAKSYCTPESYNGQSPVLYRNRGDGTFEDVTRRAGLQDPTSKGLGVAMLDFDDDGWIDLFVANDTQPNKLYRNLGNGTFKDVATSAGVAFSEAGVARAGMGVDAADYDGSGRPSIIIGNFSNEMMALYHNEGSGLFIDDAPSSAIGRASLLTLTFGCFFFDYDLDGRLDIFAVNGHVADDINRVQRRVTYAQPAHLFHNAGRRQFEDASRDAGAALQRPIVGRGAAYADYDNDGDLDLLMTANTGAAVLLRNDGGNRNGALRVRTIGTTSNRDGIGARVDVTVAGGGRQRQVVKTGSSYCSQSELPLTFGLGSAAAVTDVRVRWPSGRVDVLGRTAANQTITIQEGKGLIDAKPIGRK